MILSENGSKIFWAHEAWHDYCRGNNIQDPWQWMRSCEDKVNKRWTETDEQGHTKWFSEFHSLEEWPDDILEEYDYALLEHFYNMHKTDAPYDVKFREWFHSVKPCESQERQCNIFCPHFTSCEYRED